MASIKLITPANKPAYYKLTANIVSDGRHIRAYSRFDYDPKVLRTKKQRDAAAKAAAYEFEKQAQADADRQANGTNKAFQEVAREYIKSSKAKLEPSARLRGNYDSRKNKANTTRNKDNYLNKVILVSPWFAEKPVSEITKKDCEKAIEEIEDFGVTVKEKAYLLPSAKKYKTLSFTKSVIRYHVCSYTMMMAFQGKAVTRSSAEEISKILGLPVEQAFRFEQPECALSAKTLREHALFIRQVMQYATDEYHTTKHEFALPARGTRPRFVDCIHENEIPRLMAAVQDRPMVEQAVVLSLLNTGVRRGELAGLTWEDINFDECTVHVCKSLIVLQDYGYQLTTTKESDDRYVDVAPEYMEFMKKYYKIWKSKKKCMGASWQTDLESKRERSRSSIAKLKGNNFVICDDHGWPLHPDGYNKIVKIVGQKAGIRDLHPHMFRHTFVSLLMSNPDIGVATVAAEAGHAQPSTTLMIYTQQYKKRKESIRNQLSRELYPK